jgi:hypothetical protein
LETREQLKDISRVWRVWSGRRPETTGGAVTYVLRQELVEDVDLPAQTDPGA